MAKVIDSDHLLVNCRVKVCKDGLKGVPKTGWHKVAEMDPTIISKSLVEDLLDKQRNSYAQRTFSEPVEKAQQELGFHECARFSHLIRNWYVAEDDRGISAKERCRKRLDFRQWLLKDIQFSSFPPYGGFIKGMPQTMMEGFLSSIDTHLQASNLNILGFFLIPTIFKICISRFLW